MIGDMFNNNKRRNVCTREGQVMYMGKKYAQESSGYYVCTSGDRKRLHVAIWEHEHGEAVPPGYVIHHKDWNKLNNDIKNLYCITIREHELIHTPTPEDKLSENDKILIKGLKEKGLI